MSELKKEDILEAIEKMSVLDLSELVKAIEEKFGVSAAAPVAVAAAGPAAAPAEAAEEQTEFDVVLKSFDAAKKITVIKELRAVTQLGLKEAKDKVEGAPTTIKEEVTKEEAEEIKKKLEAAGAQVEIK